MSTKKTSIGLTPEQLVRKLMITESLRHREELVNAVLVELEGALEGYNETLEEARQLAEEVEEQTDNAIRERVDAWQETKWGQAANDFHVQWAEAGGSVSIYTQPKASFRKVEAPPKMAHAALLGALPNAPEKMIKKGARRWTAGTNNRRRRGATQRRSDAVS